MTLEKMIGNLIHQIQNDLRIMDSYCSDNGIEWDYEEANHAFTELQIELTRILIDHKYCSNRDCICAPAPGIKSLMERYDHYYKENLYENEYTWLQEEQYLPNVSSQS